MVRELEDQKPKCMHWGCMPPRSGQAALPELWGWIKGRTFFAQHYDVRVHLTSDLFGYQLS